MEIGINVGNPPPVACEQCPFVRGIINPPDGVEEVRSNDSAWKDSSVVAAYCFLASIFNASDAREAAKYESKKGPVPTDCPKLPAFKATGIK